MSSRRILEWIWQPHPHSPVSYMGRMSLWDGTDVHGFKGSDTEGVPWQTFFDNKTRLPIKGYSGDGDPDAGGSTLIELTVEKHKVISAFDVNDGEFYPSACLKDDHEFEAYDQPMMPIVDFGLLFL